VGGFDSSRGFEILSRLLRSASSGVSLACAVAAWADCVFAEGRGGVAGKVEISLVALKLSLSACCAVWASLDNANVLVSSS